MTTCNDCGREISERARTCPGCGAPGPAAGPINLGSMTIDTSGPVPAGTQLASWGSRAGAFLIDGVILSVPFFVLVFGVFAFAAADSAAGLGFIPMTILWGLISIVYKPVMEGMKGATLGKMAVGIKVVIAETGAQCDYARAFLRWFVGTIINFVPFGSLVDNLWPLWDERNQTLHDKAAGTLVVRAK